MISGVPLDATLLILAGGESRRMGRPKALLPVAGGTLIEWIAGRLGPGFAHLLVAAREPRQVPPRLRANLVLDLDPGSGPLAGVQAGLAASRSETLVAVACDMPNVTPALTVRLLRAAAGHDAAVPRPGGRPEPACAAYRRSAEPVISSALSEGRRRASEALAKLHVAWLEDEDPLQFANLNTPAEFAAFLDALRKNGIIGVKPSAWRGS